MHHHQLAELGTEHSAGIVHGIAGAHNLLGGTSVDYTLVYGIIGYKRYGTHSHDNSCQAQEYAEAKVRAVIAKEGYNGVTLLLALLVRTSACRGAFRVGHRTLLGAR